ncbi:MAG TPA: hypothetical protein VN653_17335, partial [Anaerolineales bacterium]|nr:hypothetical protein [Anaerolineales bacterium]
QEVCRIALMSSRKMAMLGIMPVNVPQIERLNLKSHEGWNSLLVFLQAYAYTIEPQSHKGECSEDF